MAKKPLYGGQHEPCCETCALGKRSSDGTTVLCQRGGAVPTYHHCRRYRYDPLRRTPRRQKAPETLDAAAFSIDEADDWIKVATGASAPADSAHAQLLKRLRSYLNNTASPDVQTILDILSDDPNALEDDKAILLAEAQALVDADQADSNVPAKSEPKTEVPREEPPVETAAPAAPSLVWIPDDTDDIFGDLERLSATMNAAASQPSFCVAPDGDDQDDASYAEPQSAPLVLTLADDVADEDIPLPADDVILLSPQDLADDET